MIRFALLYNFEKKSGAPMAPHMRGAMRIPRGAMNTRVITFLQPLYPVSYLNELLLVIKGYEPLFVIFSKNVTPDFN